MVKNLSGEKTNKKGFTLIELLIALCISSIILVAIISLYTTSAKTFQSIKDVSDAKELAKDGMAGLEWLFQRWGTSTPCNNLNTASCMSVANACPLTGVMASDYPPPSSVCIAILDNNPDQAIFYANLYGNGFAHVSPVDDSTVMSIKSCRLSDEKDDNFYHIKMGAKFIVDRRNSAVYTPLIFSLSSLSANNLFCTDGRIQPNATVSVRTKAHNGYLDPGGTVSTYTLQGGEIILRVPYRVRLFCKANPSDKNKMWLYMGLTDMAGDYKGKKSTETEQPLIPVNSFNIERKDEGVFVTMQVRGAGGKVLDVQRYFGR